MQPRTLSKRMIASAILVAVWIVFTAVAFLVRIVAEVATLMPPVINENAMPFFFLGMMLVGAGALYPSRRTACGIAAGFVLAMCMNIDVVRSTSNADETFKKLTAELDAQSEVSTKPDSR